MQVVLVEDHKVEREALALALARLGVDVVGHAQNAEEALQVVNDTAPDVVLLDLMLSQQGNDAEGLQVAELLRVRQPDIGLLILSAHRDPVYAQRLLSLPGGPYAVGYILKGGPGGLAELVNAIGKVARREVFLDPVMIQHLLSRPRPKDNPLTTLSDQELRVLTLLAQGLSNLGIAQELRYKISTVETYVSTIFAKLGLSTGPEHERRGLNARVKAALAFLRCAKPQENS
jgi:DNA-binding NarL/FixJ family response regulator